MNFKPHAYQAYAIQRVVEQPAVGLLLEMGLGKTVITLSAIQELMYDRFEVRRVLVIAPLRVAQTVWSTEAAKWEHTKHLRVSRVLGSARERETALQQDADIYVINRENVPWLVDRQAKRKRWPFDMVVIDELSSFKSRSAERFKALRRVRPHIKRIVGLTGTPAPNGLMDLWAQMYLLDGGQALGRTLGSYRDAYFKPGRRNGMVVYDWRLLPGAEAEIYRRLSGLCVSMKAADYLTLPERIDNIVPAPLPPEAQKAYERMETEMILELGDEEITAQSAATVCNKLLQIAGGAIYDESGSWHEIHKAKLEALADLVEAANGNPVLVYYAYKHEAERIQKAFPQARLLRGEADVKAWNAGQVEMMLCHPDSAGHGLNLQAGGHILVWFGLTWSLEKYQQANARLHRQGQKESVIIHHLVAPETMDERVLQVLQGKAERQDAFIEAVKARRDEIRRLSNG